MIDKEGRRNDQGENNFRFFSEIKFETEKKKPGRQEKNPFYLSSRPIVGKIAKL